MVRVAGEVADGVHVHPMHSMHYIRNRLLPGLAEGAARAYGATPNYAFQFDDLGHHGLRDQLRDCLKTGDSARSEALITDEILDQFAIVARWDDVADRMIERYRGIASRLVIYLASHWREVDPKVLERWGEVARAVRKAG